MGESLLNFPLTYVSQAAKETSPTRFLLGRGSVRWKAHFEKPVEVRLGDPKRRAQESEVFRTTSQEGESRQAERLVSLNTEMVRSPLGG